MNNLMPRPNLINCDVICWLIFPTHSPFILGLNHVSNKLAFQIYYLQHGYIHRSVKSCFPSTEKIKIYLLEFTLTCLTWKNLVDKRPKFVEFLSCGVAFYTINLVILDISVQIHFQRHILSITFIYSNNYSPPLMPNTS